MQSDRWLVLGLGNTGDQYSATRHNIGQMVIDYLATDVKFSNHKSKTQITDIRVAGNPVVLAKTLGYMNESGGPTKALADFYKVSPENLIVIHDGLDIDFNTIRIKSGGGDNGHNGLKSLTTHFATPEYFRLRMGIGRPPAPIDPADFVLKPFNQPERSELADFITRGALAVERLIEKGLDFAQQEFNK